ncbi:hypothetical protein BJV82DRAFT_607575 [Fennellomyces sp. T-0311]|nr:hypothetical protein BJV82DRAFT_607575 [Fennellomyces sp. T-0311]
MQCKVALGSRCVHSHQSQVKHIYSVGNTSRGRDVKWCVDDEGAWLHRQEWCPNGRYHGTSKCPASFPTHQKRYSWSNLVS